MQCRARGIESSPGCNTFTEKLVEDVQRQSTEGRGYKHISENTRMTPSLTPCRSSETWKRWEKMQENGGHEAMQGWLSDSSGSQEVVDDGLACYTRMRAGSNVGLRRAPL